MMRKLFVLFGFVFVMGFVGLMSCDTDEGEDCIEDVTPQNTSGKIYVAKVFALDLATEFASNASEAFNRFYEMQTLGITDVMLLEPALDTDYIQLALTKTNLRVWMISQIFFNNVFYDDEETFSESNRIWAVKDDGEIAWDSPDGWLRMACPNNRALDDDPDNPHADFRRWTIQRIVDLVQKHRPYGVSLDFIRYFAFWEGVPQNATPDSLPDTCFCDRCLRMFQEQAGVTIPDTLTTVPEKAAWIHANQQEAWTAFKVNTILSFVQEAVAAIHAVDPNVQINLHAVPWKQAEYDGAVERITGQDFARLSESLNWISPMCYAKMKEREPAWISEVVADVATVVDPAAVKIIPAIQIEADDGPVPVTTEDFQSYLNEALKDPSSGVAFWPWERITDEQKEVLKSTLVSKCDTAALLDSARLAPERRPADRNRQPYRSHTTAPLQTGQY